MNKMMYLTPRELAAHLNVHPQTVRNWRNAGKVRPAIAHGRVIRYDLGQVLQDLGAETRRIHPAFEEVQS